MASQSCTPEQKQYQYADRLRRYQVELGCVDKVFYELHRFQVD